MKFLHQYSKQIFSIIAVFLIISVIITAGKYSNAGFIDNVLGFVITPLQNISSSIGGYLSTTLTSLSTDSDLSSENAELSAQIVLLENEIQRLSLYEEENIRLSELLEVSQKYPEYETEGVNVIGKDPGNWYKTFVINKGTNQNITPNMPLISSGGLVGRTTETGAVYSKAISILDTRSSVPAMSLRTGDLGVVKGELSLSNNGLCKMEYVDAEAEILEGDEIITSNLSDIYPPGMTIGFVKEIYSDANGLTKYAIIEPKADFKHLDTILIVTGKKESGEIGS